MIDARSTHELKLHIKSKHETLRILLRTYPKRFTKDLYAGNRTSATASLRDSRSSWSGTVHWDCFWWSSSNCILKALNLMMTRETTPWRTHQLSKDYEYAWIICRIEKWDKLCWPFLDSSSWNSAAVTRICCHRWAAIHALNRKCLMNLQNKWIMTYLSLRIIVDLNSKHY